MFLLYFCLKIQFFCLRTNKGCAEGVSTDKLTLIYVFLSYVLRKS